VVTDELLAKRGTYSERGQANLVWYSSDTSRLGRTILESS
jgi:hypothetical protein